VADIAENYGKFTDLRVVKDLEGNNRGMVLSGLKP
jgi:hypothetical protein